MTSPGTVSKILWHFTGGPKWEEQTKSQSSLRKKPDKQAYKHLVSILKERKVRLGKYKEKVTLIVPYRRFNINSKKTEIIQNEITISSSPICCLADIPIVHLDYHATRYGKFAIGFDRMSTIKAGFAPVLYETEPYRMLQDIYTSYDALRFHDPLVIKDSIHLLRTVISNNSCKLSDDELSLIKDNLDSISLEIDFNIEYCETYHKSLQSVVAGVKTFTNYSEYETVYCEREWRSLNDFNFTFDDISMIVLPKKGRYNVPYFDKFIREAVSELGIPRKTPIIPWEQLIEH